MKVMESPKARKGELAQIHIGVAALKWSDADYRAVLQAVTGKASAGDLDGTQRKRFIEHLKKCGWKPKAQPRPPQGWQAFKIEQLWQQLAEKDALKDPSKAGLQAFVRSQSNGVGDARFLSVRDAIKVTEALKAWLARASAK